VYLYITIPPNRGAIKDREKQNVQGAETKNFESRLRSKTKIQQKNTTS